MSNLYLGLEIMGSASFYDKEWNKVGNLILFMILLNIGFVIFLIYIAFNEGFSVIGLFIMGFVSILYTPIFIMLSLAYKNQRNVEGRLFLYNIRFILKKIEEILVDENLLYNKLSVNGKVRSDLFKFREIFEINDGELFIRVRNETPEGTCVDLGPINGTNKRLLNRIRSRINEALPQKHENNVISFDLEEDDNSNKSFIFGFKEHQYQLLLKTAEDRQDLPSSYDEWHEMIKRMMFEVRKTGQEIELVLIDITKLIKYCKKNNLPNNESTRAEFGILYCIENKEEQSELYKYSVKSRKDKLIKSKSIDHKILNPYFAKSLAKSKTIRKPIVQKKK